MPSITTWNRLEPRSRSTDLTPGLEARVHDPLWFLARQWQMGEFQARNTGSPVSVAVEFTAAPFDRAAIGSQTAQAYPAAQPIEALVERESVRPTSAAADYRQAAEAGLYFQRLLNASQLPAAIFSSYLAAYPLSAVTGDAQTVSSVAAGRVIDGVKLYSDLLAAGAALPAAPAIPDAQHDAVLNATRAFLAWYAALFSEPAGAGAWNPARLEYGFAAAADDTGSYQAREYDGGVIDWYTFDRSTAPLAGSSPTPAAVSRTFLAAPVTFRGMPARRYWEMEDAAVNIGALSAAAEDLGRLLLREFALIYGNDWFQFALPVPTGVAAVIASLTVADTFGVTTVIPHYSAVDGASANWRLFAASTLPSAAATSPSASTPNALLIPPGAVSAVDGPPIEEVLLLRDEIAHMAWGIERIVTGPSGQPFDRATEWNINLPVTPPPASAAVPHYRLGSSVPDYWIPFVPARAADPNSPVLLKRGTMPTSPSGPLGRFLADIDPPLFLEELPREGALLRRRYRFARGADGSVYLWLGRYRSIGKGEGRSGLRFDYLE